MYVLVCFGHTSMWLWLASHLSISATGSERGQKRCQNEARTRPENSFGNPSALAAQQHFARCPWWLQAASVDCTHGPSFLPSFLPSFPSFPPCILPSFPPSLLSSFPPFLLPSFPPSPPSFLPSLLPSFLPSLLSSFPPFLLPSFLPSFLSSFPPFLLPSFPPYFLPSFLPACLPSCLPSFLLRTFLPPENGKKFPKKNGKKFPKKIALLKQYRTSYGSHAAVQRQLQGAEWQRTLPPTLFKGQSILCCPEDLRCSACPAAGMQLCRPCELPLCRSCWSRMRQGAFSGLRSAICNDNFYGYPAELFYQHRVRWIETAAASPLWTSMVSFYLEAHRGHVLEEPVHRAEHRLAIRGNISAVSLPREEIYGHFAQMTPHDRIATLPHALPALRAMWKACGMLSSWSG